MVLLLRLLYVAKMTLTHQKLLQTINAVTITYEPSNNHAVDMHAQSQWISSIYYILALLLISGYGHAAKPKRHI